MSYPNILLLSSNHLKYILSSNHLKYIQDPQFKSPDIQRSPEKCSHKPTSQLGNKIHSIGAATYVVNMQCH